MLVAQDPIAMIAMLKRSDINDRTRSIALLIVIVVVIALNIHKIEKNTPAIPVILNIIYFIFLPEYL